MIAAKTFGAAQIVDPRPHATGYIQETYRKYPHIEAVLPAMGYTPSQIKDLERTISQTDCDLVVFATPIHLPLVLNIERPTLRVRYEYRDHGSPTLEELIAARLSGK